MLHYEVGVGAFQSKRSGTLMTALHDFDFLCCRSGLSARAGVQRFRRLLESDRSLDSQSQFVTLVADDGDRLQAMKAKDV